MYLILISVVLIIIKKISKKRTTIADNGSVAIGKNNYGKIKIINNNNSQKESNFWKWWDILTGVIGLIGFVISIWPMIK